MNMLKPHMTWHMQTLRYCFRVQLRLIYVHISLETVLHGFHCNHVLTVHSKIFSLVLQMGGRTGVEGPGLSKWQRGLWGLGTVFMQYAWTRMDQIAATQHWGDIDSTPAVQRAWTMLRSCETALNVASLLNFLVFLRQGKYRQAYTH